MTSVSVINSLSDSALNSALNSALFLNEFFESTISALLGRLLFQMNGADSEPRRQLPTTAARENDCNHSHWSNSRVSSTINMGSPFCSRMVSATWAVEV